MVRAALTSRIPVVRVIAAAIFRNKIKQRCLHVEHLFQSRERPADTRLEQRRLDNRHRQLERRSEHPGLSWTGYYHRHRNRSADADRRFGRRERPRRDRQSKQHHPRHWRRRRIRRDRQSHDRPAGIGHGRRTASGDVSRCDRPSERPRPVQCARPRRKRRQCNPAAQRAVPDRRDRRMDERAERLFRGRDAGLGRKPHHRGRCHAAGRRQ